MFGSKNYDYPIIVIGAGAGGLVVAIGAAKAGKRVLLVEKGNYGGDCTNFGCIPSKSLIASAHVAHAVRSSEAYGLETSFSSFSATGALARAREIVASIRHHEDPEALAVHGVDTLTGTASFKDPHTLTVKLADGEEKKVTGGQIVIAAGSSPNIPPIEGLDQVPFMTNETIFDLEKVPQSLAVIGGGPIGSELAQAFQRLGSKVTIIQRPDHLLHKEELSARIAIETAFRNEGITLYLAHQASKVKREGDKIVLTLANGKDEVEISVTHLLVSAGRRPNSRDLALDKVGITHTKRGIDVDMYGRTSQKHVWAIGDIAGHAIFTHVAENEARTVLTNLLLPWHTKLDNKQAIPRVTYTDPEVACTGLSEEAAKEQYGKDRITTYTVPFTEVDKAITASRTEGFVTLITKKWSGKIIGATIVGPRAGEMLSEVTLAMREGIPLRRLASLIHPYPTYSLAIRKAADQWLTKTIIPSLLFWRKK